MNKTNMIVKQASEIASKDVREAKCVRDGRVKRQTTMKEEAHKLVIQMMEFTPVEFELEYAKKAALICVDEKIKLLKKVGSQVEFDMVANILVDELQELEQQKSEIEKL